MTAIAARLASTPPQLAPGRERVVREALTWLKTPWRHLGAVKGAGVDCGQFLLEVYVRAGIFPREMFHVEHYPPDWHLHRSRERYLALVEQVARRVPDGCHIAPGDIVLYRFGRCISHGAIVVAWPTIVHAVVGVGVTLDDARGNERFAEAQVGIWTPWPEEVPWWAA